MCVCVATITTTTTSSSYSSSYSSSTQFTRDHKTIPREDNDCWRQYLIADNIIFSSTNEAKAYRCVSILQSIDRFMGFCVTKPLGVKSGRPACPASQQTLLSALGWGSAISLPVQTPRPAHCTTHTNCKDSRSTATEPGLQG